MQTIAQTVATTVIRSEIEHALIVYKLTIEVAILHQSKVKVDPLAAAT